jgi:hypothetical protein
MIGPAAPPPPEAAVDTVTWLPDQRWTTLLTAIQNTQPRQRRHRAVTTEGAGLAWCQYDLQPWPCQATRRREGRP